MEGRVGSACQNRPCNSSPPARLLFVFLDAHGCTPDLTPPALPALFPPSFFLQGQETHSLLSSGGVLGGPLSRKGRSFRWGRRRAAAPVGRMLVGRAETA